MWLSHHYFRHPGPDSCVLVCSHHHRRLPEPHSHRDTEEGTRSRHLHRLGLCCNSSGRWDHPNHFLPYSKIHVWISRLPTSTHVSLCNTSKSSKLWSCVRSPIQPIIHRDGDICTRQTIRGTTRIRWWTVPLKTEWTEKERLRLLT